MRRIIVIATVVLAHAPISANAATITVCHSGCDETSVQAAVSAASPGDTVLIHPGQYIESRTISVNKSLTIQGSGVGSTEVHMNWSDQAFSVSSTAPYGYVEISDMTITGGFISYGGGGGISIETGGLVEIRNCKIAWSTAKDGGGIFVDSSGSLELILDSVTVVDNTATQRGGGIFVRTSGSIELTLDSVMVVENSASQEGGGIYLDANSSSTSIGSSAINQNTAGSDGGGAYFAGSSSLDLDISHTDLNNNVSSGQGGGIFLDGSWSSSLSLTNTDVKHNQSSEGGGGVFFEGSWSSTLNITDSDILHNRSSGRGGGVYFGGAIATINTSTISDSIAHHSGGGIYAREGNTTISRSLISGNTSSSGSGVYIQTGADVSIYNSTIAYNWTQDGDAGGIYNLGGLQLSFSTIANNTSSTGYAMGIRTNSAATALTANVISNPGGNNCGGLFTSNGFNLDDDDTCGLDGPGDIGGQPAGLGSFIDKGDYRSHFSLLPDSIAIDHVDTISFPPTDQIGRPRPQDGDGDESALCDSGAIERDEVLFADGFESGDTLGWSQTIP